MANLSVFHLHGLEGACFLVSSGLCWEVQSLLPIVAAAWLPPHHWREETLCFSEFKSKPGHWVRVLSHHPWCWISKYVLEHPQLHESCDLASVVRLMDSSLPPPPHPEIKMTNSFSLPYCKEPCLDSGDCNNLSSCCDSRAKASGSQKHTWKEERPCRTWTCCWGKGCVNVAVIAFFCLCVCLFFIWGGHGELVGSPGLLGPDLSTLHWSARSTQHHLLDTVNSP